MAFSERSTAPSLLVKAEAPAPLARFSRSFSGAPIRTPVAESSITAKPTAAFAFAAPSFSAASVLPVNTPSAGSPALC